MGVAEDLDAVRGRPTSGLRLVVSVHDVSPATAAATEQWCIDADSLGIPVSLLLITGPGRGVALTDEPGCADVLRDRIAATNASNQVVGGEDDAHQTRNDDRQGR